MNDEDKFACPRCGTIVSKSDRFCKSCGASLVVASPPEVFAPTPKVEPPYERRFSLSRRFRKLVTAPFEAMRDIALAPDYGGVVVVLVVEVFLSLLGMVLTFQKIRFVGTHADEIMGFVTLVFTIAFVLGAGLFFVRWFIKSVIIKYACDSGSLWDFRTAASITGYAYFADIVISVIGMPVAWFLIPSLTVDTTNLQAAIIEMSGYQGKLRLLMMVYSLPMSLIGLLWKSYLGGLGTNFGTKGRCSLGTGVAVFFLLGFIGLFLSYVVLLM